MLGVILDILLIVLKVIGIFLLSILGLFILLMLVILFVPIRYRSNGQFNKDEEGFEHQIYAKVTWCLHIVSINFQRVDNKNVLAFKLFGINLLNKEKKKAKKKVNKKANKNDISKEKQINSISKTSKTDNIVKTEDVNRNSIVISDANNTNNTIKSEVNIDNKINEDEKTNNSSKVSIIVKIKNKINTLIEKLKKIGEKLKNINNVKNSFIDYLSKDTSKKSIKEIIYMILKLFKRILPRKLKATVGFGFEDPSTTGSVLGMASIFYGIYGENLELEPDFDNQVLYGKYNLKGHIRIFSICITALKLYRNKWIRELITFSKETVKDL